MFGDCGLRIPFPRRRQPAAVDPEPELDPVLLVSGIGGSILNARNKKSGYLTRVWVRVFLANLEFKKNVWSLYNSDTGYTESVDPNVEILVPDDDYGLYAIDILDPAWWVKCLRVSDLYHFHDMIDMLIRCGYKKGTTLFGYGYDFRQSNRIDKTMDGLKAKLETAYKASGGKKVNIISHSMGGLLVRCFITLHHEVFAKYVNKWICIACPFQGAPGCINDSLLTGLQFVYGFESFFFVSRWTMHQLLVECPSIYEMLPNPEFKWKIQPVIKVWRKQSDKKDDSSVKLDVYDSSHCIALFEEALRNNEMKYNGKSVALPFNFSILKWASETRRILNEAQLPSSVSFYNIYGISLDSPYDVCYGSKQSPIGDLSEVCHTLPEYTYVDGDGTVPAESAKADGLPAVARVGIKASHRGLLCDKQVLELLKQWLGVTEKSTKSKLTSKVVDEFLHPDHQFGLQQNTKNIDSIQAVRCSS
ncbi:Lecithin:cholesterol/phospholipid:diacylglycerol acyltransferase protein [Dioscorea alata]|uniref:Lecithin:cholesterol/phospholipid:diacylglycerol acyltransferase protein n=1 Tax=Dioscorea alata TaxID=55571 RepID=A0ACB7WAY7_DIOAL|nr:Lecithin:cholesterol/phospholipid:diacylglycerol acyltransferase protein [Dioscorea alata]